MTTGRDSSSAEGASGRPYDPDDYERAREFYRQSGYSRGGGPWEDAPPEIQAVCLQLASDELIRTTMKLDPPTEAQTAMADLREAIADALRLRQLGAWCDRHPVPARLISVALGILVVALMAVGIWSTP